MKIGLFGGTFDPIHNGHINLVKEAMNLYHLDKVYIIPSGDSYMKSDVTSSKHRLNMAKLAVENEARLEISTMEVDREGPSYSYVTIEEFHNENPDDIIYFIIGEDSLFNIHLWKNFSSIFHESVLLVAGRKEKSILDVSDEKKYEIKVQKLIETYYEKYGAQIFYFQYDNPISSTEIRERIHKGHSVSNYVPKKVEEYIKQNKLYL